MNSTGIIRHVDELGRIVIPKEARKKLNIDTKDPIEIYLDDNSIVLKKVEANCIFCGENENLIKYKGKLICQKCLNDLNSLSKK